jgi:predicted metalloprotease with PDZ domain
MPKVTPKASIVICAVALAFPAAAPSSNAEPAAPPAITLGLDVTDTLHRLISVHETIAVTPGPVTLRYPQWVPGYHAPVGKAVDLVGLQIRAESDSGPLLAWRRAPTDPYTFLLNAPPGVSRLDIRFQRIGGLKRKEAISSAHIVRVDWNEDLLYPAVEGLRDLSVAASIVHPPGWQIATALATQIATSQRAAFAPTRLDVLMDSPAYVSEFLSRNLAEGGPDKPLRLDLVADDEATTRIPPEQLALYARAYDQADKLFGSRPYDHYDFLLDMGRGVSPQGLEHQQSSEDSLSADYFSNPERAYTQRNLTVHEYIHTWNGKLHRPAGLLTPDYNTPMQDDLLWVYEGLTAYLDKVLTVRGGLWTPQIGRDLIADTYARFDHQAGRTWRSLQDTTFEPILGEPAAWGDWARDSDYYDEATLLWLDIDIRIRALSHNQRSLDDVIRAFLGGGEDNRRPRPYRFDDLVAALNAVQPYDWAGWLRARLDSHDPEVPKDGLARAGYRLVYTDQPSEWTTRAQARAKSIGLEYSLGLTADLDGVVSDVSWDGPAFRAGLMPGDKIAAVDGKPFTPDNLRSAVAATRDVSGVIELQLAEGARTVSITHRGGLRYPHLVRIPATQPLLDAILAPRP